eukprot:6441302-Lingulodinium_polyedra.AAC.1
MGVQGGVGGERVARGRRAQERRGAPRRGHRPTRVHAVAVRGRSRGGRRGRAQGRGGRRGRMRARGPT